MANDETALDLTPDMPAPATEATEPETAEAPAEASAEEGETDEGAGDGSGSEDAPAPPGATEPASEPADTLVAMAATAPASVSAAADVTDGGTVDVATPAVTVGRIVHVALDRGPATGDCRPAIVVRVWNPEMINAQLFSDGLNDHTDYAGGIVWKTSLRYHKPTPEVETPPNTWHWSWED